MRSLAIVTGCMLVGAAVAAPRAAVEELPPIFDVGRKVSVQPALSCGTIEERRGAWIRIGEYWYYPKAFDRPWSACK